MCSGCYHVIFIADKVMCSHMTSSNTFIMALSFLLLPPCPPHSSSLPSSSHSSFLTQPFPGMTLLKVYLKHACLVLIAVNTNSHQHFIVSCDATASINVVSTRGYTPAGLNIQDSIPPNHRCVHVCIHVCVYCNLLKRVVEIVSCSLCVVCIQGRHYKVTV